MNFEQSLKREPLLDMIPKDVPKLDYKKDCAYMQKTFYSNDKFSRKEIDCVLETLFDTKPHSTAYIREYIQLLETVVDSAKDLIGKWEKAQSELIDYEAIMILDPHYRPLNSLSLVEAIKNVETTE
jgi:hypothetical protein